MTDKKKLEVDIDNAKQKLLEIDKEEETRREDELEKAKKLVAENPEVKFVNLKLFVDTKFIY